MFGNNNLLLSLPAVFMERRREGVGQLEGEVCECQCCGSGSGMLKKSGSVIRDKRPGSFSRSLEVFKNT
jgi:hypothetical protein